MTATTQTVNPNERPGFNEWMKEFKVSSRYVEPYKKPETFEIDMDKLMKSIKKKKIETVSLG